MALKSIVKVSHLSNLSDARFCSGMGVELLGFAVIPGSEHYMPPEVFQEIRGWLAGPKIIAELYGISSSEQIREAIETYAPDQLELTWEEYRAFRKDLTLPCIVRCFDMSQIRSAGHDENIVLVLAQEETTCSEVDGIPYPVLVGIASLEHLNAKISEGCFAGYVLEGPAPTGAGITNYDELGDLLEALAED